MELALLIDLENLLDVLKTLQFFSRLTTNFPPTKIIINSSNYKFSNKVLEK